jgi:fused signal recognition particle receptor
METLVRSLLRITFWAMILVVLVGVTQRMVLAGIGCPDGLGCDDQGIGLLSLGLQSHGALIGLIHRVLAGVTGVLVLISVLGVFRAPALKAARGPALLALILVGLQGWIGFQMPAFSGMPIVMVGHLLLGFVTISIWQRGILALAPSTGPREPVPFLLLSARMAEALVLLVVFVGAWVSATGAGLACPDFPTCRGEYLPPADYGLLLKTLFNPWSDPRVLLTPGAFAGLHVLHRTLGGVLVLWLIALGFGVTSNPKIPSLSRQGLVLNALVFVVVAVSMALVARHLPVVLGALHVLMALLLLFVVGKIRQGLTLQSGDRSVAGVPLATDVAPTRVQTPTAATTGGRLRQQLGKTRSGLMGFLSGRGNAEAGFLEDLEAQLLMADLGVTTTQEIMDHLTASLQKEGLKTIDEIRAQLRTHLSQLILPVSQPLVIPEQIRPFVILVVGVNGVGKTTTIGKLAKRLQQQGLSVMLAAGDTFRAAAVEQLQTWGERNEVPVIAQHTGADSASVIFDALEAAMARQVDVLIADTAGRLHNKSNLMQELSKVKRIMARLDPTAPHEILLVLDAGTGQNAVNQAKQFHEAVGLTGLVLTKLDGTAKGGVLFALARQFGIPIRYIGIGEGIDDLRDFEAEDFIAAIFDEA